MTRTARLLATVAAVVMMNHDVAHPAEMTVPAAVALLSNAASWREGGRRLTFEHSSTGDARTFRSQHRAHPNETNPVDDLQISSAAFADLDADAVDVGKPALDYEVDTLLLEVFGSSEFANFLAHRGPYFGRVAVMHAVENTGRCDFLHEFVRIGPRADFTRQRGATGG